MLASLGYVNKSGVFKVTRNKNARKRHCVRLTLLVLVDEMKPTISEHFVSPNNTNDSVLTLSGDNAYVSRSMTGRCGEDNTDCEMGLSLSMWMKPEPLDIVENVEPAPTPGNNHLQVSFH